MRSADGFNKDIAGLRRKSHRAALLRQFRKKVITSANGF